MATIVTIQDIKNRWLDGLGDIPASDQQLETFVGDAEGMILDEFPDIPERIADGTMKKDTVVRVASRMVLRVLRNPSGARTVQESAGEFSQTHTVAGDTLGEVYLTAQDRDELSAARRRERTTPKAFTVMPRGA